MADFDMLLLVGTYTHSLPHVVAHGTGIHLLGFDTRSGTILPGPVTGGLENPTYLTVSQGGTRLYSLREIDEASGAAIDTFALDKKARRLELLSTVPSGGSWPCHVSLDQDDSRLFVSNYMSGSFVIFALDEAGLPLPDPTKIQHSGRSINPERQEAPHLHQALPTPDGLYVLVCDAGTDEIFRYPLVGATVDSAPDLVIKTDPGSFPRNLVFLPDGSGFLVMHELGGKIDAYRYGTDHIERIGEISTLPADWSAEPSGAAIRIHPSGRFAYAANRGHDSIFGVDLSSGLDRMTPLGWWSSHGKTPRDFNIDPSGRFLIVANQDSDTLVVYAIDPETGALSLRSSDFAIGTPVNLTFLSLD
jgi:6-phosphogluconolactonase